MRKPSLFNCMFIYFSIIFTDFEDFKTKINCIILLQLLGNKVAKEYPALLMPLNMLISQTRNYPIKRQTWHAFMFGDENVLITLGHIFLPGWIGFKKLGILDRVRGTNN